VPVLTVKYFRILHLLIIVGLILSIAGGTSSTIQPNGTINIETTSKVGIILFLVAYVGIALMLVTSLSGVVLVPTKERRIAGAIIIAMPFILVRLAYSACVVFLNNHTFSLVNGSVATRAAMAVVEEMIVVAVYILVGFFIDRLEEGTPQMMPAKVRGNGRGQFERRRRHGPKDTEAQPVYDDSYHGGNPPLPVHYQGVTR
jgi:hypothetical protein